MILRYIALILLAAVLLTVLGGIALALHQTPDNAVFTGFLGGIVFGGISAAALDRPRNRAET